MLFQTDNDTEIGWIWNPFTAEYSEEFLKELKEYILRKSKAKMSLAFLVSLAYSI